MIDFTDNFTLTIGGRGVATERTVDILNPATGTRVAKAPLCTAELLDQAVASARAAFPGWRDTPIEERRQALVKMAEALNGHAEQFARLFTLEQGRPLDKAAQEILGSAFWCQAVSQQAIPVTVNEDSEERYSETRHIPIGVVGGIVPWNFPMLLGIWKIAPALLTGNTIIIKTSPHTPLTMLKLGELMREHLPPGVFNVITGDDDLGPLLTSHPGIDKISFTGSSETGRRVMASAAASLKRVTLELGGNDAAIVMPDVEMDGLPEKLFWAAFGNSGQICIATKRLYIHEDIYDFLAAAIVEYARGVKVADGLAQGAQLGPIQNRAQFDRVKALIADAKASGLRFMLGGEVPNGPGYFVPVAIVDNPPEDSPVVQEEAFGPVLPLLRFRDVDEVVTRVNASPYGLAGSIWSRDTDAAQRLAERLETGTVWINETQYIMPWTPFGGHKQSGLGVENGQDGLLEFTNSRTVTVRRT